MSRFNKITKPAKMIATAPVKYSVLSKNQMIERMKNLHDELTKIKKQRDRLKDKVESLGNTVTLHEHEHNDFIQIIAEGENIAKTPFQKLFWEQQAEAAKKTSKGMRWHPLMIRWCILLRHYSQKAYETMRHCVSLPSQRTLRDYTHHLKAAPGFSDEVDQQICNAAHISSIEERERYSVLLIDEMHIREDLVFDKHTGNNKNYQNYMYMYVILYF